jgi:hypothetical protein
VGVERSRPSIREYVTSIIAKKFEPVQKGSASLKNPILMRYHLRFLAEVVGSNHPTT